MADFCQKASNFVCAEAKNVFTFVARYTTKKRTKKRVIKNKAVFEHKLFHFIGIK